MIKPSVFYKGSCLTTEKSDALATVAATNFQISEGFGEQ